MLQTEQRPHLFARALDEFEQAFGGDGLPRPFADLRARAAERLAALGVPTRRDEAWKYTDLRRALARDYRFLQGDGTSRLAPEDVERFRLPGLDAVTLFVVNGALVPALSDDVDVLGPEVRAGSLRRAAAEGGAAAEHFGRYADADRRHFVALNQAFDLDGFFVHVGPGARVERPIHVVHLTDSAADAFVQSRNLVVVEGGAQVRLVESHHVLGGAGGEAPATFANVVTEVVVGEGAVVEHQRLQEEGDAATQVNTAQVVQRARSTYTAGTFTLSGGLVRNDLAIVLEGEHAEANLLGLYVLRGEQHVDNHTLLDHAAPGCPSNELYKGIVFDRATGVFNGKVFVRREGQQTNAYQQSQGVVLSDDARHFSKPELEIYADDVKCSHGSTTGEIDPDALFYLRSRGIGFDDARAILLYAFARDVVERVQPEALRRYLDRRIEAKLRGR